MILPLVVAMRDLILCNNNAKMVPYILAKALYIIIAC